MKKSILFLCQYFYPEKVSSATLPFDTAVFLSKHGFKVDVLCGYSKEYNDGQIFDIPLSESINGVFIKRIKYKTFSKNNFFGRLFNYFNFTFKCLLTKKPYSKYDYVVVYSNPPILPYVAYKIHKKQGSKIVFVSYDVYPEIAISSGAISSNSFASKLMNNINKKIFKSIYKVITLSDEMKGFIIDNRNVCPEKVVTIPNWFDKEENNSFKYEYSPKQKFVVSFLGNLGICQDSETILNSALLLKDNKKIEFLIGGHGSKMSMVESFINEHKLDNIKTMPFLSGEDYKNAMNNSDCFLLSLKHGIYNLCYPSKYYSYLYYGRPIIAIMDCCQLTEEIEKSGIGFSFRNNDAAGVARTLEDLCNETHTTREVFCENSRRLYMLKYNREQCLNKYKNLFDGEDL